MGRNKVSLDDLEIIGNVGGRISRRAALKSVKDAIVNLDRSFQPAIAQFLDVAGAVTVVEGKPVAGIVEPAENIRVSLNFVHHVGLE